MKFRHIFKVLTSLLVLFISACSKEDDDPGYIWEIYPIEFEIKVVNSNGENLLDPKNPDNILDTEMYVIFRDEKFDVRYGYPDGPFFPYPTKALPVEWLGAFIAPYFEFYPGMPERENYLYIGQFYGDSNGKTQFKLYIDGQKFTIYFTNKITAPENIERHYFIDDKEIPGPYFTLTL